MGNFSIFFHLALFYSVFFGALGFANAEGNNIVSSKINISVKNFKTNFDTYSRS